MAVRQGVVQTVLTGTIKPNAIEKLRAFGLEEFFDLEIGGYGSQVYPKGAQLMMTRSRAAESTPSGSMRNPPSTSPTPPVTWPPPRPAARGAWRGDRPLDHE